MMEEYIYPECSGKCKYPAEVFRNGHGHHPSCQIAEYYCKGWLVNEGGRWRFKTKEEIENERNS